MEYKFFVDDSLSWVLKEGLRVILHNYIHKVDSGLMDWSGPFKLCFCLLLFLSSVTVNTVYIFKN